MIFLDGCNKVKFEYFFLILSLNHHSSLKTFSIFIFCEKEKNATKMFE